MTPHAEILDAVATAVSRYGLARFTMEDVARHAGLARQTIYRHFPSKDALIDALIAREEGRILDDVATAMNAETHLDAALERGVLTALRLLRSHPLLAQLLDLEPAAVLPYLTTEGHALIQRAAADLSSLLEERLALPHEQVAPIADTAARIVVSHVLTPTGETDETVAARIAPVLTAALEAATVVKAPS